MFSDKDHFWLNGGFNKQNCRTGIARAVDESQKIYNLDSFILTYSTTTVTFHGACHQSMTPNFLLSKLQATGSLDMWFQQDDNSQFDSIFTKMYQYLMINNKVFVH